MTILQDSPISDLEKPFVTTQMLERDLVCLQEIILIGENHLRRLQVNRHQSRFVLGRFIETVDSHYVDLRDFGKAALTVSRFHARIDVEGEDFLICDLNSRHGSYLAGQRLEAYKPEPLASGSLIRLAHLELKVLLKKSFHPAFQT
jgi:pSer/pThr/pTyr-binding forkhead associated (FHA) protein